MEGISRRGPSLFGLLHATVKASHWPNARAERGASLSRYGALLLIDYPIEILFYDIGLRLDPDRLRGGGNRGVPVAEFCIAKRYVVPGCRHTWSEFQGFGSVGNACRK